MIKFTTDPQPALDHLKEMKYRILEAVRLGMSEGMAGLGGHAAANAPVFTDALRARLIASPKVRETATAIVGTVDGDVGKKHEAALGSSSA
jgi:hypothetical protein